MAQPPPATENRFKRFRILFALLFFAVTFVLTDLVAGMLTYHRFTMDIWQEDPIRQFDPSFHHGFMASSAKEDRWGPMRYTLATNSLGFRDRAVREIPLASDVPRVVFIGDSFTEGIGYDYEQTFVGLADEALAARGVEVLNAAVSSYSPCLFDLKMRTLIEERGLQLDELHVFIDISDPQDEIGYASFVPGSENPGDTPFGPVDVPTPIWEYSRTFRLIKYEMLGKPSLEEEYLDEYFDGFFRERARWTHDEAIYDKWGREGLELAAASMDRLVELCERHDIRVTVTIYPWPEQVRQGLRTCHQTEFWAAYCQERGIEFLDLFAVLIGDEPAEAVLERYYIHGDIHFNEAGHRLVTDRWMAAFFPPDPAQIPETTEDDQ